MRWLITGGCGFIGRNLIKNLLKDKDNYIRIIDNLSVGTREKLSKICNYYECKEINLNDSYKYKGVELLVGDILDADFLEGVTKKMDVIVHLAANTGVAPSVENPKLDCLTNVMGTLNCLEAARINNVKNFVFASSGAPIGECKPPINEELAPHPVSPYGASKLSGEGYCSAYHKTFGLKTVALRFSNVFGPLSEHKDSVVAKFIKKAIEGKTLEIYGDGNQTRDFIYVDDLVKAIKHAVKSKNSGGQIYQIATNKETSISELLELITRLLEENGCFSIKTKNIGTRIGDVKRNFSETTKAYEHLKWRSNIKLEEGLRKTIKWFLKQY